MCLCCVGWMMLFTNAGKPICVSRECIVAALKILAIQLVVVPLDFLFWSKFVGLVGWQLYAVWAFADLIPSTLQALFVTYLMYRYHKEPRAVKMAEGESCCHEDPGAVKVAVGVPVAQRYM